MAPTQPTPATWTIRFRHHRTTVLLHVDPLQNIASIKAELLSALQQSCADGKLTEGIDVPDAAADLLLARPVDINNPSAGWNGLSLPAEESTTGRQKLGKGKGKAREGSAAEGVDAESLKSLGIKDNALLGFAVASASEQAIESVEARSRATDEDSFLDEDTTADRTVWDVVMPDWDDQYDVTNHGDAGVLKAFEG